MSYRLHSLSLAAAASSANLSFEEDFAVVAGQTAEGQLVLPTCPDTKYLVAGGVQGLPYLPLLGRLGARLDFNFSVPVVAIVVATYSDLAPIPQAIYQAPAPTGPVALPTVAGVSITSTTAGNYRGDETTEFHLYIIWKGSGSSPQPANIIFTIYDAQVSWADWGPNVTAQIKGKTYDEIVSIFAVRLGS